MSEDDILAALDAELGQVDVGEVVDFTTLDTLELNRRFGACRRALYELGEMREPTTDEGRRLHSERVAMLLEMRRRGAR